MIRVLKIVIIYIHILIRFIYKWVLVKNINSKYLLFVMKQCSTTSDKINGLAVKSFRLKWIFQKYYQTDKRIFITNKKNKHTHRLCELKSLVWVDVCIINTEIWVFVLETVVDVYKNLDRLLNSPNSWSSAEMSRSKIVLEVPIVDHR